MQHFVVMGVSGCGKSTIAEGVAQRIDAAFIEADALHSDANISKMASGEPLTDDDRWPWLKRVATAIQTSQIPVVVSCSCLKRAYRDVLCNQSKLHIGFIHLHTDRDVIAKRMAKRSDHFMPTSLLDSQIAVLEMLDADENGVLVDVNQSIDLIVDEATRFVKQTMS